MEEMSFKNFCVSLNFSNRNKEYISFLIFSLVFNSVFLSLQICYFSSKDFFPLIFSLVFFIFANMLFFISAEMLYWRKWWRSLRKQDGARLQTSQRMNLPTRFSLFVFVKISFWKFLKQWTTGFLFKKNPTSKEQLTNKVVFCESF